MAFQQGLSGLNSSSRALDVISNNVANASTVGYKAARAIFTDMYASALSGVASSLQIGSGGKTAAAYQSFGSGSITTTNNPLDMAIINGGFFVIQRTDGTTAYSRNGQFDIDNKGYIITPFGERLMGYRADENGVIAPNGGIVEPLFVPQDAIPPKATTNFAFRAGNLSADDALPVTTPFDPTDVDSYNYTSQAAVYDSLGGQHTLSLYFVRTSLTPSEWEVYATLDGDPATQALLGGSPSLEFDGYGKLNPAPAPFAYTTSTPLPNGANPLNITVDLGNMTQFGSATSVGDPQQDGYAAGQIAGLVI
ncbi:MAG: flagellar hook protein FlgE, partial [Azoarcus sp.]|nr:flagellar hook protein FlgE [Azoarcus sp.]